MSGLVSTAEGNGIIWASARRLQYISRLPWKTPPRAPLARPVTVAGPPRTLHSYSVAVSRGECASRRFSVFPFFLDFFRFVFGRSCIAFGLSFVLFCFFLFCFRFSCILFCFVLRNVEGLSGFMGVCDTDYRLVALSVHFRTPPPVCPVTSPGCFT